MLELNPRFGLALGVLINLRQAIVSAVWLDGSVLFSEELTLEAPAIVDRAIGALGSALKSVIYLFDPGKIVLYGRLFENSYYLFRLLSEMREGVDTRHAVVIEKSRYNQRLEDRAASLLAVQKFFEDGCLRA